MADDATSRVRMRSRTPLLLGSAPMVLFLLVPLLAMVFFLPPERWWEHLRSETAMAAVGVTLRTTAIATLICVAGGLPVAFLLARATFRWRGVLDTLIDLPITIPPVVAGVALLLAFGRNGLVGRQLHALGFEVGFTTAAVVMAQVFIASPFFIKTARAGFEAVSSAYEHAAWTLGASRWRAFRHVVLPLASPSLLAGVVLAWARALSEFGATMMFAGNFPGRTQTLTLAVMSAMDSDVETAVAVSTLTIGLAIVTLVGARWLVARLRLLDVEQS